MDNQQKIINANSIFDRGFLCGKSLYLYCFGEIPNNHFINNIDGEKAFEAIRSAYGHLIKSVYGYRYYDKQKKQYVFNETFAIMQNGSIIEFDTYCCQFYHNGRVDEFINECTALMRQYKEKQRRKPLEINLISRGRNGIELKQLEVKRTKLNLDLFYEDDFKDVNEIICKRLNKDKDKGIVLLHGLSGTGKTTYLRHLIGKIKKRILFVSPNVAGDITSPDFIQLLVNNPNSVLIIEDAENVIMDRKLSGNASVSNLLNVSDGLLADFLNVQLICTFNSSLTLVDNALLRKGRLIAKYEFGKLGVNKAQKLSNHLGFEQIINRPMTIAEIANPGEQDHANNRTEIIGFGRKETLMN
jgi:energy-coupling factor transporter ATP-binding protein EcfA2